ncbi:MAG: ketopantoate reductase family protein [Promethearchaeota archaeon]
MIHMLRENPNIIIYGTGAIGATLGGWLTKDYNNVYLLARGNNLRALKSNGLILYEIDEKNSKTIPVNVIEDLNEVESPEIILIVVKNYDLEEVAKDIYEKVGNNAIIVGLQNGIENQKILPKYFSKIIYGVIVMSAWRDSPGVFGTRGKNLLILGTKNNKNQEILERVTHILNKSFPTKSTKNFQDAAHSKLVMNLINSIFTLIDQKNQDEDSIFKLWKIFVNTFLEGVKIVKAAGYKEYKLKGLPNWKSMEFALNLDRKITLDNFRKSISFSWLNSMAQDMLIRQKQISELETLNGYLLSLADKYGLEVPYNRTIYKLCKESFTKIPYKPLDVEIIYKEIKKNLDLN